MIQKSAKKLELKDSRIIAGVAGWPIHHSLSPLLHNFWIKQLGLNAAYIHFAVRPDEAQHAFRTLKNTNIKGMNVTLPLKELAFKAADETSGAAKSVGVSNCLYVRGNKLIAHNTDLEGFSAPLLTYIDKSNLENMTVVLIGAGGASRAVVTALLALGVKKIRVINRTDERATALVALINKPNVTAMAWSARALALFGSDLVVNATAAGMSGKPELDIDLTPVNEGGWIYDLIYTPLETSLMKQAKLRGLNVIGGLDMLIEQARPSFELFFGHRPPKDGSVKALLIQHLSK